MLDGLSTATVVLNNETISVVPNSISMKLGAGESVVKTETFGNGSVEPVYFENLETKKSMLKFSVMPKDVSLSKIKEWKASKGNNVALLITPENSFTFTSLALISDPDIVFSSDGEIELEFNGAPVR